MRYASKEGFDDDTVEDAFMRGYEDDEAKPCIECGAMVDPDMAETKVADGEELIFCSTDCVDDYFD